MEVSAYGSPLPTPPLYHAAPKSSKRRRSKKDGFLPHKRVLLRIDLSDFRGNRFKVCARRAPVTLELVKAPFLYFVEPFDPAVLWLRVNPSVVLVTDEETCNISYRMLVFAAQLGSASRLDSKQGAELSTTKVWKRLGLFQDSEVETKKSLGPQTATKSLGRREKTENFERARKAGQQQKHLRR